MRRKYKLLTPLLFITPALSLYLFYFLIPIPMSFYFSFFDWDGYSPPETFVGFDNWKEMLKDDIFWNSLIHNFVFVILTLLIQIPLGLGLGLLISMRLKGMSFMRTVYFFPLLLSSAAIGILWKMIYEPNFGALNAFLKAMKLDSLTKPWLGDYSTALGAVYATTSWQWIPFYMIVFAAAISEIPRELYEAAKLDGASSWQSFLYVTLPCLKGTIMVTAVLGITGSLKYFDLVYIMTEGGPGNSTDLLATYMYKLAFNSHRMGYGSTVACGLFIVSFALSYIVYRVYVKGVEVL